MINVVVKPGQKLLAAGGYRGSCSYPFRNLHVPPPKLKRSLALRASRHQGTKAKRPGHKLCLSSASIAWQQLCHQPRLILTAMPTCTPGLQLSLLAAVGNNSGQLVRAPFRDFDSLSESWKLFRDAELTTSGNGELLASECRSKHAGCSSACWFWPHCPAMHLLSRCPAITFAAKLTCNTWPSVWPSQP